MELRTIPLEKITGSVYQPRLQEDRELRRLIRSIDSNGLRVPIIVQDKRGDIRVVCGHRRIKALAALQKQGKKTLPPGEASITAGKLTVSALVLGPLAEKEAAFTGFIENQERLDLSPYEQAVCYRTFVNSMGFTRAELVERVEINKQTLDYMISALSPRNLTLEMIKSWKNRKLTLSHVATLFRLRRHKKRQQELYRMILDSRLAAKDAELRCNQLLDSPDLPLSDREYDLIEKRLLGTPALKGYIDKKWLRLGRSARGERLDLSFESVDELRDVLTRILASLEGLLDSGAK